MSTFKVLIIASVAFFLCIIVQGQMRAVKVNMPFESSVKFANKDVAYHFTVKKPGDIFRLEVNGKMPWNSWKAIELEVFDPQGRYLFTLSDELWAETGRDSEGTWRETKERFYFEQRFSEIGQYAVYITDAASTANNAKNQAYRFRVVQINGKESAMTFVKWVYGIIAGFCILIFMHRAENKSKTRNKKSLGYSQPKKGSSARSLMVVSTLFATPFIISYFIGYDDDIDEVNWVRVAQHNKKVMVDRDLRQQSLSGAAFRTGGSRGGK